MAYFSYFPIYTIKYTKIHFLLRNSAAYYYFLFSRKNNDLTVEDLSLLCDLFYLPFEHGGQGLQLLQEFNWLKSNAHLVISANQTKDKSKPEVRVSFFRLCDLRFLNISAFRCKSGLRGRKRWTRWPRRSINCSNTCPQFIIGNCCMIFTRIFGI